uniref:Endoglucanase n=1 Tax=uncultured bacterium Contig15 TaxID=1393441 RepID=W0FGU3_9BACT|nr:GH9 beta-1,3(4)-glucanase [uncultured bacterium Contig15]
MNTEPSVIRINQEGYSAGLPVSAAVLSDVPVLLKSDTGEVLRTFSFDPPETDPASGDAVTLLDLGPLQEGCYELQVGSVCRRFTVRPRSWNKVTHALIKGLYYQRCGCELTPVHAGSYAHPACHTAPALDWEDRSIHRRITGGWHDAGDYGKYVGPGAVTVAHLLYTWKLFPRGCSDPLNIPESGNGLPDILNEARYELDWLLQMQRSDGSFHHKLTKALFAPFIMPQDDREPEYLMPLSFCATGDACACLALASRIYRPFDEAFANRMLLSARRAWDWLQAHPDFVPFMNPEGVRTGWYRGHGDTDDRFWAACELFSSTGEKQYQEAAEKLFASGLPLTQFGWADVAGMGALCCLFDLRENAGDILGQKLREEFLRQSEDAFALSRASGYGTALAPDGYVWGSILPVMSGAMTMIMNALLTGRQDMRDAALLQWHYALGLNALDLCFVTGFGEKSVLHPHHRPSDADGIEAPVPGLISGGPNNKFCFPQTREKLSEDIPPAKYFLDETPSADTNEIAIYWNSPAVFVGAYFNSLSGQ